MLFTLQNEQLTVTFTDMGGEIYSVRRGSCEYLWQGDPTYWNGRAPVMFPICGRLWTGKYTYAGKTYEMNLHGFARKTLFAGEIIDRNTIRFTLEANAETLAQYPFPFLLTVTYVLDGDTIRAEINTKNTGSDVMPFAPGAHPGFNVPLDGKGTFSDYRLEFGEVCSPDHLLFSETCYQTGKKEALPLENGTTLPLRHTLFDNDAIFLARPAHTVTLKSDLTERFVKVFFPDMAYLGIWHKPKTEAPYVCIEPWCGLPAFDGEVDDFAKKSDMFRILPGTEKAVRYEITFG